MFTTMKTVSHQTKKIKSLKIKINHNGDTNFLPDTGVPNEESTINVIDTVVLCDQVSPSIRRKTGR